MTPGDIAFSTSSKLNIAGMFYAGGKVTIMKQTSIAGSVVSNYFDMGTDVPSIFYVPMPPEAYPYGLIMEKNAWSVEVVGWKNGTF